jgi:hypothetical protein
MSNVPLLIQVIGLQRSGNHAIIDWLQSLFPRPVHHNDRAHDYLADPARIAEIRAMSDRDCVIVSFEDSRTQTQGRPVLDSVRLARRDDFPDRRVVVRYILRDPYNGWASRAKAHDQRGLTSSPAIEPFIADWKALARLCQADPDAFLCYNHWFRDAGYRRAACARLGGRYSEATLDEVPRIGGGSSFDGYVRPTYREILADLGRKYLKPDSLGRFARDPAGYARRLLSPRPKGGALAVEERWRFLIGRADAAPLFADRELAALSEAIFGFSIAADGTVRTPAAAPAKPAAAVHAAASPA